MNQSCIPNCCSNKPKFLINYNIGSKYFVCSECFKLDYWGRGISEKKEISDVNL
jgi:hypothetical protein